MCSTVAACQAAVGIVNLDYLPMPPSSRKRPLLFSSKLRFLEPDKAAMSLNRKGNYLKVLEDRF